MRPDLHHMSGDKSWGSGRTETEISWADPPQSPAHGYPDVVGPWIRNIQLEIGPSGEYEHVCRGLPFWVKSVRYSYRKLSALGELMWIWTVNSPCWGSTLFVSRYASVSTHIGLPSAASTGNQGCGCPAPRFTSPPSRAAPDVMLWRVKPKRNPSHIWSNFSSAAILFPTKLYCICVCYVEKSQTGLVQ